jgi:NhaP-type Na+/H+ and K+/H+ antiporter
MGIVSIGAGIFPLSGSEREADLVLKMVVPDVLARLLQQGSTILVFYRLLQLQPPLDQSDIAVVL